MGAKVAASPAVLVLPLHGHLAPAAWALAQAGGAEERWRRRGSATCRPAEGRCRARSQRDVAELRERGLLCGHVTAAPAYGGEHEAISVAGALDAAAARLGWDVAVVGPGPGIIGSGLRARSRRDGGPRQRPRGPRAGPADDCSRRGSPRPTRESATAASATTRCTVCSSCCWRRSRSPCPRERPSADRRPCRGLRPAPPAAQAPADLDGYAGLGPAGERRWAARCVRTRSSSPLRSPRAPPCGARDERRPGEPPGMAIAVKPPQAPGAGRPGSGQALRGTGPRLPLLPGAGARALAQHPQRLPHRPPPVRGIPRRARSRRAQGAAGRHRRVPRRPRHRQRPPARARLRRSTARPPACAPSTSTCAATS